MTTQAGAWTFDVARVVQAQLDGPLYAPPAILGRLWTERQAVGDPHALLHGTAEGDGPDDEVRIRALNSGDGAALTELRNASSRFAGAPQSAPSPVGRVNNFLEEPQALPLGAWLRHGSGDSVLVAWLVVDHRADEIGIINVKVRDQFRNRGLAQALLFAALHGIECACGVALTAHELVVEVDAHAHSPRLRGLYERYGFSFEADLHTTSSGSTFLRARRMPTARLPQGHIEDVRSVCVDIAGHRVCG